MIALATTAPDLGGWFHTLSPYLFEFTPGVGIRWYGLAYALAFVWGWVYLRWAAGRGVSLIPASRVGDAIVAIVLGVVVGGRLGYVLFYEPSLLWDFRGSVPFWGVLAINNGGMSSHGGGIGVVLAAWRISRGWKDADDDGNVRVIGRAPMLHVLDVLALGAPVGLMLGRLANFINGELLGRIVAMPGERAPWWAVRYPQEIASAHDAAVVRTPAQERALLEVMDAYRQAGESDLSAWERVMRSVQRGNPELVERLEPLISARAPSQLVQAACEGLILGAVLWFVARKPQRPGIIGCWFVIMYGLMRLGTEMVRLPDSHLGATRFLGLTRGQWYSTPLIGVGVVFLFIIAARKRPKLGGWAVRRSAASPTVGDSSGQADSS